MENLLSSSSTLENEGPEMKAHTYDGMKYTQAILSDTFQLYPIHVLNPNGKPNTPNAYWNGFHITEYLDPSTLDSRAIIHEVHNGSGISAYIEGDQQGQRSPGQMALNARLGDPTALATIQGISAVEATAVLVGPDPM